MSGLSEIQKKRKRKIWNSWTGALLVAGILLLSNFIISFLPIRLDTSEGKIYSISSGTKSILKRLDDNLVLKLFFSSDLPPKFKLNEQYIRDLLSEYKRASGGKIRVEYVDPGKSDKSRMLAIQSGISPVRLDVREKDRREVKECFMGIQLLYIDKSEVVPFIQDTSGLEYEVSRRIKKLISPDEIKIGIVTTGKSLTFEDDALKELKEPLGELFTLVDVDLDADIPSDLKSVWVIGPQEEIASSYTNKLKAWVDNGGTLGLLIDRHLVEVTTFRADFLQTGFEDLLESWGVKFKSGLVVDPQADRIQVQTNNGLFQMVNIVDYPYFPLVGDLNREHPTTKAIDVMSLPFVSPLIVEGKDRLKYTTLAKSSKYSWLNTSPTNLSPLTQHKRSGAGTESGPFDLGLIIEGDFSDSATVDQEGKPPQGRVIVFGTSRFVRTDFPPRQQNFSLFMNLMDWSGQDEELLSIRSTGAMVRPLRKMSDGIRGFIKYSLILFLPLVSILIGLFVWRRGRLRRAMLPLAYREV